MEFIQDAANQTFPLKQSIVYTEQNKYRLCV